MKEILESLPPRLMQELSFAVEKQSLREIHLRVGRQTEVVAGHRSQLLDYRSRKEDLQLVLDTAMNRSYYASREFLREGFCTAKGGCRIGITGTLTEDAQGVRTFRELTGLNIRIARPMPGLAGQALDVLRRVPDSMLIIGPPGCGKTTLLRDLIRLISDELWQRVGVVDTRFELGAVHDGIPAMDLGQRTDLLSGGTKEDGMGMLLRCMNPRWIAVDEITAEADVRAMVRCYGCGVMLLATAHAWDREDLRRRPVYRPLRRSGIFRHLVEMEDCGKYRVTEMEAADG